MSDQIALIIVAGLLLMLFLPRSLRRKNDGGDELEGMVPSGFGNGIEAICQYLRKEIAEPALGKNTDRFIKYIWSVFFFILTMNLLGLVPIPGLSQLSLGFSIGGTATSNIWVTGTLALTTLFMMVFGAAGAVGTGAALVVAIPVVAGSVAISLLEIFVACLQAFIFAFLTTLFIGMSIEVHDPLHLEDAHV
ncbi:MAG: F0F1 ATP synthase subunit A [Acidobacteriota bacterium]